MNQSMPIKSKSPSLAPPTVKGESAYFYDTSAILQSWFHDIKSGKKPIRYKLAPPLTALDIAPKRITAIAGAPGAGKTALMMQIVLDILALPANLNVVVANVEMGPKELFERGISSLTGIPATDLMERNLRNDRIELISNVLANLLQRVPRVKFLKPPFTLEHIREAWREFPPHVLTIDYIQRFSIGSPDPAKSQSKREQVEDVMAGLREFADTGLAILILSAVSRQKGNSGSTYAGLGLASMRDSSELEFGSDSVYLMESRKSESPIHAVPVRLQCAKRRYGQPTDIYLNFNRTIQKFETAEPGLAAMFAEKPKK